MGMGGVQGGNVGRSVRVECAFLRFCVGASGRGRAWSSAALGRSAVG